MVFDRPVATNYHHGMARLSELMEKADITGAELARRVGAQQPEIWRLAKFPGKGGRKMTLEWAKRLAPELGVEPADLLDELRPTSKRKTITVDANGEKITFPEGAIREIDIRAGLGAGQTVPDAYEGDGEDWHAVDAFKGEAWVLPPSFVRSGFRAPISKIIAISTQGESMAPTINHGDVVFVDTTHQRVSPPGLYAMRDVYGEVIIKRLDVYRDGREIKLRITSDNKNEPSRDELLSEVAIVGRVCGMFKLT